MATKDTVLVGVGPTFLNETKAGSKYTTTYLTTALPAGSKIQIHKNKFFDAAQEVSARNAPLFASVSVTPAEAEEIKRKKEANGATTKTSPTPATSTDIPF